MMMVSCSWEADGYAWRRCWFKGCWWRIRTTYTRICLGEMTFFFIVVIRLYVLYVIENNNNKVSTECSNESEEIVKMCSNEGSQ